MERRLILSFFVIFLCATIYAKTLGDFSGRVIITTPQGKVVPAVKGRKYPANYKIKASPGGWFKLVECKRRIPQGNYVFITVDDVCPSFMYKDRVTRSKWKTRSKPRISKRQPKLWFKSGFSKPSKKKKIKKARSVDVDAILRALDGEDDSDDEVSARRKPNRSSRGQNSSIPELPGIYD